MKLLKCRHFFLGLVMTSCIASLSYGQSLELLSGSMSSTSFPSYSTGSEALPENTPGSRSTSPMWSTPEYVYVYAGQLLNFDAPNDMWRFHKTDKTWQLVSGGHTDHLNPVYGEKGVSSPENTPGARQYSATWTGDDGNLYLYGGRRANTQEEDNHRESPPFYCDMWKFDTSTLEWTWIHGDSALSENPFYEIVGEFSSSTNPPGGEHFAAWKYDGKFYLYGGSRYDGYHSRTFAELWCFDPSINQWMIIQSRPGENIDPFYEEQGVASPLNHPGSRSQSACEMDTDGNLWLFSGYMNISDGYNNDLWKLNMETMEWTYMCGNANTGNNNPGIHGDPGEYGDNFLPPGLLLASLYFNEDGKLVLFGGYLAAQFAQVWYYDTKTNQWAYQHGELEPSKPSLHKSTRPSILNKTGQLVSASVAKDSDGSVFIYGGYGASYESNRLWKMTTPQFDLVNTDAKFKVKVKENPKKGDSTKINIKGTFHELNGKTLPAEIDHSIYVSDTPDDAFKSDPVGSLKLKIAKPPKPAKPGNPQKPAKPSKYSAILTLPENLRGRYVTVYIETDEQNLNNNWLTYGPIQ